MNRVQGHTARVRCRQRFVLVMASSSEEAQAASCVTLVTDISPVVCYRRLL
jgi:hypothetical protein